jgi:hypothetical protein
MSGDFKGVAPGENYGRICPPVAGPRVGGGGAWSLQNSLPWSDDGIGVLGRLPTS